MGVTLPLEFSAVDEAYAVRNGMGFLVGEHVAHVSAYDEARAPLGNKGRVAHVCVLCGGHVEGARKWYCPDCETPSVLYKRGWRARRDARRAAE